MGGNFSLILLYATGLLLTIFIPALAIWSSRLRAPQIPVSALLGLTALNYIFLLVAQLFKLYNNRDYLDFAAWVQICHNIASGSGAISQIQESLVEGKIHWFSAHFTPLVYLFGLAFRIVALPETLLVLQWLVLGLSLHAVYLCGRQILGSSYYALIGVCLFSNFPTFQYISLYEFEMLRFCIPIILYAIYFFLSGQMIGYWCMLVFALLIREEVGLTTFGFGIWMLLFQNGRRLTGLLTAVISIAYAYWAIKVVMPYFDSGPPGVHIASHFFGSLGASPGEFVRTILTQPGILLAKIFDPIKLGNVCLFFQPLGFTSFFGWPWLIPLAGNLGLNMLSDSVTHVSYLLYYLSPSIPFIFMASFLGMRFLGNSDHPIAVRLGLTRLGLNGVLYLVFLASLVNIIIFGPSPISLAFWIKGYKVAPFHTQNFHYSQYFPVAREWRFNQIAETIPLNARVSTDQHLMRHFYDRLDVSAFPDLKRADYVVIDKERQGKTGVGTVPGSWEGLRTNPQFYYDWVEKDPQWELILKKEGYFVFRRKTQG